MDSNWKRPKDLPSKTTHIDLPSECGTLHLIMGYQDEVEGRLVEVHPVIGKSGICGNVLLDSLGKAISMYLQSPMPRYKIIEKFKKQFVGVVCSQGVSCVDIIARKIIEELEA